MATTLTELSTVVSRLHAMGQRHPGRHRLHERLALAAAEFEGLIHLLLITAGTEPVDGPSLAIERPAHSVPARAGAEAAFLLWLSGPAGDRLPFRGPDDPGSAFRRLLASLSDPRRRLPRASAAALGLPPTACVGQAVIDLLVDITGPADHGAGAFGSGVGPPRDHDGGLAPRHAP